MNKSAPFFIIVAASLWGVDGIILRPVLFNLPVPLVVFIESTIVAVLLTPFMFKYFGEMKNMVWKDWLAFAGVALLGGAVGTMAITKALFYVNYVNLSIVILIQKLQPVFAISLAAAYLKEKLPVNFFVWTILAIAGAYFMTFGFSLPDLSSGDKTLLAALFSLLAAISFSSSTVLSKRALKNVGYELGTYLRFAITSVIMLLIVLIPGTITSITDLSGKQTLIFILIAFSTGGPAIFIYYFGLKKVSASVSTICELAFPLTAVILEYYVHGNVLGTVQWIGASVLLISILRVTAIKALPAKTIE